MAAAKEKSAVERLNELHDMLCGEEKTSTEFDKVINILEQLNKDVEKLQDHSHSIT